MFTYHDFLNMRSNIDRGEFSKFMGYKIKRPNWLLQKTNDNLNLIYDNFENFYNNGEIYLSCILRANSALFRQINGDRPAQMLYTNDDYFYSHPEELLKISDNLYNIKKNNSYECNEDDELYKILNDDYYRPLNVKIPLDITNNHDVWVTSIMMIKEHIPFHKISNFFYPLLVLKDVSVGGMIVPKWYWSKNFRLYSNFHYDNRVKPVTYKNIPNGARDFFELFCSIAFFKEHPLYYIVFTILEIISIITPLNIYVHIIDYFSIHPSSNIACCGTLGTLLISCGFINVIWSFMDKYLGNKVTFSLFTIGITLVMASILLS